MKQYLLLSSFAIAFVFAGTFALAGAATTSAVFHVLPLGPTTIGRNVPQVSLTASYSVIGGGASQAQDLLTYISNGSPVVVALSTSPTIYMVDSGTQWNAQAILNGSNNAERWISTQQALSGTISAPLTVSFSYYHQYTASFNFNVTNGGNGYTGPPISFTQMGAASSAPAPVTVWVDAFSSYSYPSLLPGSTASERWVLALAAGGQVIQPTSAKVTYYHEFLVSASYSIIDGGSPLPPMLASTAIKSPSSITLTAATQSAWFDSGATYSFTPTMGLGNERWQATVLMPTQSGNVISTKNNGTVTNAVTLTPAYYHQYFVNVTFNFLGGSTSGLTLPAFNYMSLGSKAGVSSNAAVWVDAGTQYTLPDSFCCLSSPSSERWALNNSTSGTIGRATKISSTYFHQYFESFSFAIIGQPPPSPWAQPSVSYVAAGNTQLLTLQQTPQTAWSDAGSSYSATSMLSGSTSSQRWFALSGTGIITGPAPLNVVTVAYNQQYLLTIVGGGLQTQWVNAGSTTTLNTPGIFGRSQGAGYRITTYQIDNGAVSAVSQPGTVLTIQIAMNGPHTLTFQSVRQFQLTLDAGAMGALSSITPPTAPGDNYWYDTDSNVQVTFNGAYARANGVGQRITSIVATALPTKQVNTVGQVQAFSTNAIETPISITTTSTTQYEVVLNSAALAALGSIAPPSTFPNDTFWYDSGAPPATVALNAVYARSAGTGFRITSWQIDSGPTTLIASTGTIIVTTSAMTSAHFLNATVVTQYQVTIDKGGTSALSSMTNPPIPQDSGWYDASNPFGIVMNGVWGRASGTGQRLSSVSINSGTPAPVLSNGLVVVLNLTKLSAPEAVTTTVVTQYQVTLDGGGALALASITSTPIPKDNYWFDSGAPVTVSLNGVWGRTASSGTRLLSYSVNQGASTAVLSSNPVQALSLPAISSPESVTTKAAAQYHLTSSPVQWVSLTNSTVPGDAPAWFDSGTAVKAVYNQTWNQAPTGSRSSATSYTIDSGSKTNVPRSGTGTFTISISMNGAHSITLASVTQYLLSVVGPAKASATPPSQTGDAYFDSGTKVTLTVPSLSNASSKPGERQVLISYSLDGGGPVVTNSSASSTSLTIPAIAFTRAHQLVLNAVTQYQVAFQFFDGLGRGSVAPSDVLLGVGNETVDVQGQPVWLTNGTSFRVLSVTWESASVGPTPAPSFQVQGAPLNVTLNTRVYPASLKVVDLFGLPVSGAQISMTLANGTTITGTTKGDGTFAVDMVPLGSFTAKVSNLGSSAQIVGSSSGQPVAEGKVFLSLISLVAIVALVGGASAAGFVLLRKTRKAGKETAS